MNLRKAERKNAKIKMAIQGSSGSGKTMSALLLAYGITDDWSKIAVIDTENGSADLYAHLGTYQVLPLKEPFSPERYISAIETCSKAMPSQISSRWGLGFFIGSPFFLRTLILQLAT